MADAGRQYADEALAEIERLASEAYAAAEAEAGELLAEYLSGKRRTEEALTAEAKRDGMHVRTYRVKRRNLLFSGEEWAEVLGRLSEIYTEALRSVAGRLSEAIPAVFAYNAAYTEYVIERETGYELYGGIYAATDALAHAELLVLPSVDGRRDDRWNRQRITAEMMQGIAAGVPIDSFSGCLADVTDGAYASAMGTVRALITGAENAGRQYIYRLAADAALPMRKVWRATFDHRVRYTHKTADGQAVDLTDSFLVGCEHLMYPGDPAGSPHNVKNCRCGMEILFGGSFVGEWDAEDFARWMTAKGGTA